MEPTGQEHGTEGARQEHGTEGARREHGTEGARQEHGDGELRASDADRQRVADILRQHCGAGRLDVGEYTDRVTRVYAARTLPELFAVTADLPQPEAVVPSGGWALASRRSPRSETPSLLGILVPHRWAVVGFVVALIALVVSVYGPIGWAIWVFWVFLAVFVVAGGVTVAARLTAGRK